MEEFLTYEYTVEPKGDPSLKRKKVLLIIGYILYCGGLLLVFTAFLKPFLPVFAVVPLTMLAIVPKTWRYANPEYEYSITSGILTFSVVYGNRVRKKKFEIAVKSMETVAPYTDTYKHKIEEFGPKKTYVGFSSEDSPDAYFAIFENENGEKCVYYFEATQKSLKVFRHYNPKTVVSVVRF